MNGIGAYFLLFAKGSGVTIAAWFFCGCMSLLLGTFFGIAGSKKLGNGVTRAVIRFYTFIAKGIPAYVQILIAYFVIPAIFGVNAPAFIIACMALAFCSSGYDRNCACGY
jgi:His/Glu/Gln/Arg/opine family amino acid ABC transporter permease subunit